MVGLAAVDNTTDAGKPLSTATIAALLLKAPTFNPTFTGSVGGLNSSMVGLGNVDNTTDAGKPLSTATITALALKVPVLNPVFTSGMSIYQNNYIQFGASLTKEPNAGRIGYEIFGVGALDIVGGGAVVPRTVKLWDNVVIPGTLTVAGTTTGISATMVGLGNVSNTSDASKPLSTADVAALALKAPLASPVFTGNVTNAGRSVQCWKLSTGPAIASYASATVLFDVAVTNIGSALSYSAATGKFTASVAGLYGISAFCRLANYSTSTTSSIIIYKNTVIAAMLDQSGGSSLTWMLELVATDSVSVSVTNQSATASTFSLGSFNQACVYLIC